MTAAFPSFLRRASRATLAAFVATASACGGAGAIDGGTPVSAIAQTPAVPRGTLLQTGWSAYPRLVRLSHQSDPLRNGVIVASVTEVAGGSARAGFHASLDDGASFGRIGT